MQTTTQGGDTLTNHPADRLLSLAESVGRATYGRAGGVWMTELQVAHALRCPRAPHYSDNPKGRIRHHVLIQGPPATAKSSTAEMFLFKIAGAVDHRTAAEHEATQNAKDLARMSWAHCAITGNPLSEKASIIGAPTIYEITGGTSFEKARGSLNAHGVVPTPMSQCDYVFITELFEFMGSKHEDVVKTSLQMNRPLEEGRMVIDLVKGVFAAEFAKEVRKQCLKFGMKYDPAYGTLSYDTPSVYVACTTPPDEKALETHESLKRNGFFSRWTDSRYDCTALAALDDFENPFGTPPQHELDELIRLNRLMWGLPWSGVPEPPASFRKRIDATINEYRRMAWEDLGTDPVDFLNNRERNSLIRIIAVGAIVRRAVEVASLGAVPESVEVDYEEGDLEFALRYTHRSLTQRVLGWSKEASAPPEMDQMSLSVFRNFIDEKFTSHGESPMSKFKVHALTDYFQKHGADSPSKAWRMLSALYRNGWLVPTTEQTSASLEPNLAIELYPEYFRIQGDPDE